MDRKTLEWMMTNVGANNGEKINCSFSWDTKHKHKFTVHASNAMFSLEEIVRHPADLYIPYYSSQSPSPINIIPLADAVTPR